jgi:alpha-tubulin suppressor-like RCC1 family protein
MENKKENFIKKFLTKKRMEECYSKPKNKITDLNEDAKTQITSSINKIFKNTKNKSLNKKTKSIEGSWTTHMTPYGIFFYNKEEKIWVNNFGKTADDLSQLIDFYHLDFISSDSSINSTENYFISGWGDNSSRNLQIPQTITTAEKISTGYYSIVATLLDGSIVIWGSTPDGNLYPATLPNNPSFISSGAEYFLAINEDQTITPHSYGNGNDYLQATPPAGLTGVIDVSANSKSSCALKDNGEIFTFGDNEYGQLDFPPGIGTCIDASMGGDHGSAIKSNFEVVCWGNNDEGQCNVPAGFTANQVITGEKYTCALKGDGTVSCWGLNSLNQCDVPVGLNNVIKIKGNAAHTVALKSNGTAVAWGYNEFGQCNILEYDLPIVDVDAGLYSTGLVFLNGDIKIISTYTGLLAPVTPESPIDIKANLRVTMVLQKNGKTVVWGALNNPLGNNTFSKIRNGKEDTIYAIKSDNSLVTFVDYSGQNDPNGIPRPSPLPNAIDADGGYQHSVILKPDGTVVCWGWNFYNQCNTPAGLGDVVQVTATAYASFALKSDGTIVSWGGNNFGERNIPGGLSNVIKISGGWYHMMALKSDGTVVCWGNNDFGRCDVPVNLNNVIDISGGENHSAALKSDRTMVAWGSNAQGQLNIPAGLSKIQKMDGRGKTIFVLYA